MALPTDGQNANELDEVTEVPAGKELMFIDPTTNAGGIITLENLTKQILNGLKSQAFALDAGQMTLLAALNKLNSDSTKNVYLSGDGDAVQIIKDNWNSLPQGMPINLFLSTGTVKCIACGYSYVNRFGAFFIISVTGNANGLLIRREDNYTWHSLI